MKLAILGGGGMRMPLFLRHVLLNDPTLFQEVRLLEPSAQRRRTVGALCEGIARRMDRASDVVVTDDPYLALDGVDFVFSAVRVGGDGGRVIDEQVALGHGLVGQETTGAGGAAMALRTIPVLLEYCAMIREVAPRATVLNFTNPAGIVTEALTRHGGVSVLGICDTPSELVAGLARHLGAPRSSVSACYGGLNHLGWVTALRLGGEDRLEDVIRDYEQLQELGGHFGVFEPGTIRRIGAIPSEYVAYYFYPDRYKQRVAEAGTSRGKQVALLNDQILTALSKHLAAGDFDASWRHYEWTMRRRSASYMALESGERSLDDSGADCSSEGARGEEGDTLGGYEAVALQVIAALSGGRESVTTLNVANGGALSFLDADSVVEVPCRLSAGGIERLVGAELPRHARALVMQVKEYELALVRAAVEGSLEGAEWALALNPLVSGVTAARSLLAGYRREHGDTLAYLN